VTRSLETVLPLAMAAPNSARWAGLLARRGRPVKAWAIASTVGGQLRARQAQGGGDMRGMPPSRRARCPHIGVQDNALSEPVERGHAHAAPPLGMADQHDGQAVLGIHCVVNEQRGSSRSSVLMWCASSTKSTGRSLFRSFPFPACVAHAPPHCEKGVACLGLAPHVSGGAHTP
jgi:hypothetical protein